MAKTKILSVEKNDKQNIEVVKFDIESESIYPEGFFKKKTPTCLQSVSSDCGRQTETQRCFRRNRTVVLRVREYFLRYVEIVFNIRRWIHRFIHDDCVPFHIYDLHLMTRTKNKK